VRDDSKHVVFGRVIAGQEVIKIVENELTDKSDKPFSYVSIANCGELIKKSAAGTSRHPFPIFVVRVACCVSCVSSSSTFAHLLSNNAAKAAQSGTAATEGKPADEQALAETSAGGAAKAKTSKKKRSRSDSESGTPHPNAPLHCNRARACAHTI
jgi:hypothetical protein